VAGSCKRGNEHSGFINMKVLIYSAETKKTRAMFCGLVS
jgi:hypothetical protein